MSTRSGGSRVTSAARVREGGLRRYLPGGNRQQQRQVAAQSRTSVTSEARQQLTQWIGHEPSTDEIRGMVGAPPGAHVSVERNRDHEFGNHGPAIGFYVAGPPVPAQRPTLDEQGNFVEREMHLPVFGGDHLGAADRYLLRGDDGKMEMHNSTFRVLPEYQGQGIGLRMLATEAKTLGQMGVARIGANMAGWRRSSDQGYRVWPLMGYNTLPGRLDGYYKQIVRDKSLPRETRSAIKRAGKNFTILDLYATGQAGRDWWREHGSAVDGYLDLTPGSRSMQVLRGYVAAKGLKWEDL